MTLSEFQLRARVVELEKQNAELTAKLQRVVDSAALVHDDLVGERVHVSNPRLLKVNKQAMLDHPPTPDMRRHTVVS